MAPMTSSRPQAPKFDAGMFLRFGDQSRAGLKAKTCYEAILSEERTSTTRFPSDSPHQYDRWKSLQPGDVVRVWSGPYKGGWTGRYALVEITRAAVAIDLAALSDEETQAWSLAEGWAPSKIAEWILTGHETKGIQVRYRFLSAQPADQPAFSGS